MDNVAALKDYLGEIKTLTEKNALLENSLAIGAARERKLEADVAVLTLKLEEARHDLD